MASRDRDGLGAGPHPLAGESIVGSLDGAGDRAEAASRGRRFRGGAKAGANSAAGRAGGPVGGREGAIDLCSVEPQTRCS
jgi:hypothetical protein